MAKLKRFSLPARLGDRDRAGWNRAVKAIFDPYTDGEFPQFYDPTERDTPAAAADPMISWAAFPKALRATEPSQRVRWELADGDRELQDEYCEWTVERRQGKIVRIVFTTELPEHWEHLFRTDPNRVLALYRRFVDPTVELDDLRGPGGGYLRENEWNRSQAGRLVHMIQRNNNLGAAVDLVAKATIPRQRNGRPVVDQQDLVRCAQLGNPLRNSDPQIAAAANRAARAGDEITFADPIGIYLGRPLTAGMVTPDGADAAKFWKVERGDAKHTLRARFEVPPSRRYTVGDIEIEGRRIEFGGQVADRIQVWVSVRVKDGNRRPKARPCEPGA